MGFILILECCVMGFNNFCIQMFTELEIESLTHVATSPKD